VSPDALTKLPIVWKHTGDAEFPYTAEAEGRRFTIRINDFPAEPLYTLLADSEELTDLEDWPPAWVMPAPPQALLDMLGRKGEVVAKPRAPALPLTLPALLAAAAPLVPLEACPICASIPKMCSRVEKAGETYDGLGAGVRELRPLFAAISGYKLSIDQCPTCHRLYECESGYEYFADGSEDSTTYTRIDDVDALFHSDWFTRVRVADRELVGHALVAAFGNDRGRVRKIAPRTFFRRHCIVQVELDAGRMVWLALPDDRAKVTLLTGNLDGLGLLVREDPPSDLAARALDYALFADELTTPSAIQTVSSVDAIPWRRDLTDADRQIVEELRSQQRVHAPRLDTVDDRYVVTRWVISEQRLIRRAITISANGAAHREDFVVREALPVR
jgi:hypothetical protein